VARRAIRVDGERMRVYFIPRAQSAVGTDRPFTALQRFRPVTEALVPSAGRGAVDPKLTLNAEFAGTCVAEVPAYRRNV
jgi:hypothetical protein